MGCRGLTGSLCEQLRLLSKPSSWVIWSGIPPLLSCEMSVAVILSIPSEIVKLCMEWENFPCPYPPLPFHPPKAAGEPARGQQETSGVSLMPKITPKTNHLLVNDDQSRNAKACWLSHDQQNIFTAKDWRFDGNSHSGIHSPVHLLRIWKGSCF